ncbi:MAG: hypothetical protein EA419_04110 [Wenzhouxiangella sp.]|nr:MAG: hypothetical protein EA419_04110 [Wenzhouxiangella sp.]
MARTPSARSLYRLLYKRLFLPRSVVHRSLSALKRIRVGDQVRQRRELAETLGPDACGLSLDEKSGFHLFGPDELPGAEDTARRCRERHAEFCRAGHDRAALERNPAKRFLLSVLSGNEFHAHPELIAFMVSEPIVRMASHYLGTVPVLEGAALWWTPPNDSLVSSQMVHIDELAPRQVKILLNCTAVGEQNGPLQLLPADVSDRLRKLGGHSRGRLDDSWLEQPARDGQLYKAMGPPGSGVAFDSSRCLHFGSRGNTADRLVLAFHFLPLDAPTETRYHIDPCQKLGADPGLSALQKLALGFQAPGAGR